MSATAQHEKKPAATDGILTTSSEPIGIEYQWHGMEGLSNPLTEDEFGPPDERPCAETWQAFQNIWKKRADEWLKDWQSARGQYRRKISLLQSGLQHFDPRILRLYILMADGHRQRSQKSSEDRVGGLSAAAFKALFNHVFALDPYASTTLSATIEAKGSCQSWLMLPHDAEMVTLFAWFFRRRHGCESDNLGVRNSRQYEILSLFYRSFVMRHWSLYCDSPDLAQVNNALKTGRHALLRTIYETGFWFNDPAALRWQISAMDFSKFLAPEDIQVLETLLTSEEVNGYSPGTKSPAIVLPYSSKLKDSASMAVSIITLHKAGRV